MLLSRVRTGVSFISIPFAEDVGRVYKISDRVAMVHHPQPKNGEIELLLHKRGVNRQKLVSPII